MRAKAYWASIIVTLGAVVHEQMFRSGGQFYVKPSAFSSQASLVLINRSTEGILGQVMRTTSEFELPLQISSSRQREDFELDRFNVHQPPLHCGFSVVPVLELSTRQSVFGDHNF
ncbi:hypothetical protein TNCV_4400711 [Trichonephila clavipes]|nr:hypothetical protein TNCV_4400711 [Trichonephila clavipes]